MKVDFSDLEKVLREITEKHKDKIEGNQAFVDLLNKLSVENDKKNQVIEELVTVCKDNWEYSKNTMAYVRLIKTRLSALEIAVAHIEKGNEKWLELVDNLQDQIDTLAEQCYVSPKK